MIPSGFLPCLQSPSRMLLAAGFSALVCLCCRWQRAQKSGTKNAPVWICAGSEELVGRLWLHVVVLGAPKPLACPWVASAGGARSEIKRWRDGSGHVRDNLGLGGVSRRRDLVLDGLRGSWCCDERVPVPGTGHGEGRGRRSAEGQAAPRWQQERGDAPETLCDARCHFQLVIFLYFRWLLCRDHFVSSLCQVSLLPCTRFGNV